MRSESLSKINTLWAGLSGSGHLLQRWREGLLECLSPSLRRRLVRAESRLLLALGSGGMQASLESQSGDVSEPVPLRPGDGEGLRDMLRKAERADAVLDLMANPGDVLVRRFHMPAQVKDTLARVLTYELDRLTPFQADAVYFDYRVVPGGSENQLGVEMALLRRDRVDASLDTLATAGAQVRALIWPGAWPGANLLPKERRQRPQRGARILSGLLWMGLLGLTLAVLATPLMQKRRIVEELSAQAGSARGRAQQVTELRERLIQSREAATFVLEKKRTALYVSDLLRRLTELLPDHTWINQLNVNGNTVDFRGESRQATGLIEVLSADPAFSDISFKSPVVGIRNTDQERFHIEFTFSAAGDAS